MRAAQGLLCYLGFADFKWAFDVADLDGMRLGCLRLCLLTLDQQCVFLHGWLSSVFTLGCGTAQGRRFSVHVFNGLLRWLPDEVEQVDINDLETLVAEYAADLADNIAADLVRDRKTRGGSAHDAESSMVYLAQFGDSQVHFDHVAPGSTANSHGLRFLYRQRAVKDQHRDRVTITQHVLRGRNQPADSLSNGQVEKFKIEMQSLLGPDLKFTQLDVSLADTSLAALIDWKVACSQGKTSS